MPVECRNSQRRLRLDTRQLKGIAQRLLEALEKPETTLSLWLTDDRQMARLHQRWMGEFVSTDVLSFSQVGSPGDLLGDVAISVETAARRSPKDVQGEIVRYLIHGVLHLVGHDHVKEKDRRQMEKEGSRLKRLLENHA